MTSLRLPPIDPLTLAGTTALVMLAAGTASIVPAFRAARLDPSKVLRF